MNKSSEELSLYFIVPWLGKNANNVIRRLFTGDAAPVNQYVSPHVHISSSQVTIEANKDVLEKIQGLSLRGGHS